MSRSRCLYSVLAALALAGAGLACNNTRAENEAAAKDAGQKIENAADKTADAAKELAQDVKREAGPTAEKIGEAAKEAGKATVDVVDAKKQLLDIKAALMADSSIDASRIDVDADAKTNTIHISGMVPTVSQKAAVGRIAKEKAAGYTIHNMLTVEARTTSR